MDWKYFRDSKLMVNVITNPGYKFTGWNGSINSNADRLEFMMETSANLIANFEKESNFKEIVINEINYNSNKNFNTEDWIELYNNTNESVNLSNWIFSDVKDSNIFVIPQNTYLESNAYLVISRDTNDFIQFFDVDINIVGNYDFGLSNGGELIRLFDANKNLVDSVRYRDHYPWPTNPDGTGKTLELKNPNLDNGLGDNWGSSLNLALPGEKTTLL